MFPSHSLTSTPHFYLLCFSLNRPAFFSQTWYIEPPGRQLWLVRSTATPLYRHDRFHTLSTTTPAPFMGLARRYPFPICTHTAQMFSPPPSLSPRPVCSLAPSSLLLPPLYLLQAVFTLPWLSAYSLPLVLCSYFAVFPLLIRPVLFEFRPQFLLTLTYPFSSLALVFLLFLWKSW
jgi:hypothetical protein